MNAFTRLKHALSRSLLPVFFCVKPRRAALADVSTGGDRIASQAHSMGESVERKEERKIVMGENRIRGRITMGQISFLPIKFISSICFV